MVERSHQRTSGAQRSNSRIFKNQNLVKSNIRMNTLLNKSSRRSFISKGALAAAMFPLTTFGEGFETAIENTPKNSIPSDLKITDTKCGCIRNGHSLFVKIHTNQGIWGCGEGVDATT